MPSASRSKIYPPPTSKRNKKTRNKGGSVSSCALRASGCQWGTYRVECVTWSNPLGCLVPIFFRVSPLLSIAQIPSYCFPYYYAALLAYLQRGKQNNIHDFMW